MGINVDLIIVLVFLFYIFHSSLKIAKQFIKSNNSNRVLENFDLYIKILNQHMDKAFEIIHKDRILIYSIEATKPNDTEVEVAAKDYAKLVLKLIGPMIKKQVINIYGNEETLLINLIEDFRVRFEEDNIREHALKNIMSSELEEEKNEPSVGKTI